MSMGTLEILANIYRLHSREILVDITTCDNVLEMVHWSKELRCTEEKKKQRNSV